MKFAEELPHQCPPVDAKEVEHDAIFRLLPSEDIADDHFKSHAALNKPNVTGRDPCAWASCSLLRDPAKMLRSLPRMRETLRFAAKLKIPAGAGVSKSNKNQNHVDFWRYADFDMVGAVVEVVSVDGGVGDD